MRVEMTFNDEAISVNGYKKQDIYQTLKKAFIQRGLRCSSDNEILSFEDSGNENDYANMWVLLVNLLKFDWFVKCASSCVFFDDDDTTEDVLCQATEIRQMLA